MPPTLALLLWLVLLLALLRFDPAKEPGTSWALWLPATWMFFVATRLPSQWLGGYGGVVVAQALEEGNPLDRASFSLLILLATVILVTRSFNWGGFFARNVLLLAFLSFALISVCWSDFPFVAFKRWFRDLGNYLVILVVLSDPQPREAIRTLLRRLGYLLIPLSVLLIKYFPELARHYDTWTGLPSVDGATTSKNMLGVVCLICGLFFVWDTVTRWSDRKESRTKRIILVNLVFLAMTLWTLNLADSATSRVCLVLGCLVIWAAHSQWGQRHDSVIKVFFPACFCLYLLLAFGFDLNGEMARHVGRNPNLTDRTIIWESVLSIDTNPLVGTGYESFWLGPRLERVWRVAGHVNEAHNGYLEVYLNLGLVGLALLTGFLITSYRYICRMLQSGSILASFSVALWTIILFYNMTEAAFKSQFIWLIFLLTAIAVPERVDELVRRAGTVSKLKTDGERHPWKRRASGGNHPPPHYRGRNVSSKTAFFICER
jgi:exopolysaccharide production protein ExoQ